MKKFLAIIILVIVSLSASAEFRWGPTAGVNFTQFTWRQNLLQSGYKPGANAGVIGELMIPGIGFGIDMGLLYNYHTAAINLGSHYVWSSEGYGDVNYNIHSIQIPAHLRFKWTRMNGLEHYVAPFAYIGPAFTFPAVTSKCDAIEHPTGSVSLQFGIGGEFLEHLQLSFNYQWGISYEIRTVKLDNLSGRPSAFNVNIAWLF